MNYGVAGRGQIGGKGRSFSKEKNMFAAKSYIERRNRLMGQMESGLLLFLGNDGSPMNYKDNPYPYRQDSTFLYFFGLAYAGLNGLIDVDESQITVFGDELTMDDIVWVGRQPTIEEMSRSVGVEHTAPLSELKRVLKKARDQKRKIHFTPPYRAKHLLGLLNLLEIPPLAAEQSSSLKLIKAVVAQRNIKTAEEIAEIEKAVNITAEMHLTAYKTARPGLTEAQVAAAVQEVALAAGGQLSFPIIATIHGETIHNHHYANLLKDGDLFLLDAGAETDMGYAGDLSSTVPVARKFNQRQKEIYRIVFEAHQAAVASLKPGIRFKDAHFLACKVIAQGLKELGLMKGDPEEAVAQGAHALFFPCGLGHMLGLDVHDMENLGEIYVGYEEGETKSSQFGLNALRLARPLQPGFVLTVEPGVYFIPELIDLWKSQGKFTGFINYDKVETFKGFGGLRTETDHLITATGQRPLGKPVPRSIEAIETVRR
jgi:Xaa-Pro aminopeptidase